MKKQIPVLLIAIFILLSSASAEGISPDDVKSVLDEAEKLQSEIQFEKVDNPKAREAAEIPITITPPENKNITIAPYFTEYIRNYIKQTYGSELLYSEGLQIYTPLNLFMQRGAQKAVESGLANYEKREGFEEGEPRVQGALVAMDPQTGYVKALVGGVNFLENQFNRALQARRQPGSAFKPIVYAAALEKGFSPDSIFRGVFIWF